MYAHLIKGAVITALTIAVYVSSPKKAEAWTPCMPLCDFLCTAPAALMMSVNFLNSHLSLTQELLGNIDEISNLSNSLVDRNAAINALETQNITGKITALDGASFKITSQLSKDSKELTVFMDSVNQQLEILSKNKLENNKNLQTLRMQEKGMSDAFVKSLSASSTIQTNVDLMNDLRLVADLVQSDSNTYEDHEEVREKIGLLSDIPADVPNPFITDEVDMVFFNDYQKQIVALFNHKSTTVNSVDDAISRAKNRLIIDSLNLHIFENAAFEGNGIVEDLAFSSKSTVARSKADIYKRLMLEKDALTAIDNQTTGTLMLTKLIVTSQKNLLLNEILKVKKIKNMLLALDEI